MGRKIQPTYSTVEYLDDLYHETEPKYAFRAKSLEECRDWRDSFREKLIKLMGIDLISPRCDLKPEILERKEADSYFREKLSLQVEEGFLMPCYLLIPKNINLPLSR